MSLEHRYNYHPPSTDAVRGAHERVRATLLDAAVELSNLIPEGREAALVQTKLEEAMFWANAAIARNQEGANA